MFTGVQLRHHAQALCITETCCRSRPRGEHPGGFSPVVLAFRETRHKNNNCQEFFFYQKSKTPDTSKSHRRSLFGTEEEGSGKGRKQRVGCEQREGKGLEREMGSACCTAGVRCGEYRASRDWQRVPWVSIRDTGHKGLVDRAVR